MQNIDHCHCSIFFQKLGPNLMDDVGPDRRTADGVEFAVKHVTQRCALEVWRSANWFSDHTRLTLDFVLHTLSASANSPVVATAGCAVVARLAASLYLFVDLNFSIWAKFLRRVAPAIDRADCSGLSPDLTVLLAQLWQRDDVPLDEEDFSTKGEIKTLIEAVGRTVSQLERTAVQPVSQSNIRQIRIEDLDLNSALPSVRAESQNTHSGEDVSGAHGSPSIPSSSFTRPLPSARPSPSTPSTPPTPLLTSTRRSSYVTPTPYTDAEKSSGSPYYAGRAQWPRRPADPVGKARNGVDFDLFDEEPHWGLRSVAYFIETVLKSTMIDMSRTSKAMAYEMYGKMVAADNLVLHQNIQILGAALFLKAPILDMMADGNQSRHLTTLLKKLFDRGKDAKASHRRYIQGLCQTLERKYKYSRELLQDEDKEETGTELEGGKRRHA